MIQIDPERETPYLGASIRMQPQSPEGYTAVGDVLLLRKGRDRVRSSESLAYNLAVFVARLGDPDGAAKIYNDVLKIDPDHSMSWNNLGAIHDRAGRREEAIRCVVRAQADPMNIETAYNLGVLLMRSNKVAQAISQFK